MATEQPDYSDLSEEDAELMRELDAELAEGCVSDDLEGEDDDTVTGDGDEDTVTGEVGDDTVAGAGDDTVAGAGDDTIAGAGTDTDARIPGKTLELHADDTEAKKQVETLTAERAALREQYKKGDIERDVYDEKLDEINDKLADAKAVVSKAEMYREITEKAALQQWESAVDTFMADPTNEAFREGGALNHALDATIRKLHADDAAMAKFPDHSKRLAEAKRLVIADTRKALGLADDTPKPGAQTTTGKPATTTGKAGTRPKVDIPPSVDDVPAAGDEQEDEFAHIDRLPAEKQEAAFARLSAEQQARFLERA